METPQDPEVGSAHREPQPTDVNNPAAWEEVEKRQSSSLKHSFYGLANNVDL